MCKISKKECQQVKHGPSDQTRPNTIFQNQCGGLGHHEHECKVKAQVSGNLSKFVMRMSKMDQLPLHRGVKSRALPFSL